MDQISRPYSHDIFHKASYRRPSFLSSVLPSTTNSGHDSPAHLGSSEIVHPSQYGILASRALLTPPSSDVGTIRRRGCANDSDPASRNHTNGDHRSPLSSRASSQYFEWPSTPTRRPLLSPNPRCHGLDGTSQINPSIESYTFPPTGNTRDRSAMISASEHSSLNEMTFVPPPPYRRTPPPVEYFAEALAEHAHYRPATTLCKSSEVMHNAHSEYSTNALGLDFTTHLPTPSPSPPSSLTDLPTPTETSTTSLSVPKRRRLRITIPETPITCGTPSPPRPVTALYYPQSGAGDICPSPPVEDSFYQDSVFPEVHDHASVTSYDERGSELSSKSVRFAEETIQYSPQYSPQSPPRLARWKCIPLPPDYSLEESLHSPVDVSFAMLSLHDDDYASHLGFTHDSAGCIKEQLLPVTNLPQDTGVDLLSPLPLTPAPSYCLEDLQQQISQCLDSTDRIYSTIASSPVIPEIDVATVFADLTSALQGVRKESLRPAPDLELLAKAHGAEWRRKYERVVMSLDRNLDRCVRAAEEAGARGQHSRHLLSLKDTLVWHARKFEDLRRRLEVFHDHISLLEKRAEYQELTMAVRAEMNAERAYRQTFKVATEGMKARRHALKEHIRCEEEAARTRWSTTTRSH